MCVAYERDRESNRLRHRIDAEAKQVVFLTSENQRMRDAMQNAVDELASATPMWIDCDGISGVREDLEQALGAVAHGRKD